MTVLQVARINAQNLAAVQVSMGTNGQIAGQVAALLAAITGQGYETESLTGPQYPGGWRIKLMYGDDADQFAYPGDWILVTDATYTDEDGWTLQSTSRATIYGFSTGLVGTATDFVNTFTANTPIVWAATTTAPTATAETGLSMQLAFPQPTSADGPFTYSYTLTDQTASTTAEPVGFTPTLVDGNAAAAIPDLTEGHEYSATVTVTDHYGQTATSLASNTVTATT
ncbi:hypothetical protein AWC11_16505 [Mycobacterium interjectum]|nr:hypothetical protein AWC11_16505 [Mycobacterium interjectum]